LASHSYKSHWEKHLWAFVKVLEGSEIYNIAIHHLVHFSFKIRRKTQSNWVKPKCFSVDLRRRRRRACRGHAAAARLGVQAPPACAPGVLRCPRPRLPRLRASRDWHAPRALWESAPAACRAPHARTPGPASTLTHRPCPSHPSFLLLSKLGVPSRI
jgi:hypothetical protein